MMNSISKVVDYTCKRPLNSFSNSKVSNWVCKEFRADNARFIGGVALTSILLKDGLGCYMYVKQSLNNEKIPEDKRKFVAALDLANGGLMILLQLLTYVTISNKKVQAKIFDKMFGKYFDRAAKKGYQAILKNNDKYKALTGKDFSAAFESFKKTSASTLGSVISLVAATVFAKRVLVPFIATPLAEHAKSALSKGEKSKDSENKKMDKTV